MNGRANQTPAARRQTLRFASIDQVIENVEALIEAERGGRLEQRGNWTLGQTLGHLATWASFAFDGYPPQIRPPMPIRLILRLMRGHILTKGMMPGVRLRGVPGGTVGTEPLSTEEGFSRFRAAFGRLRDHPPTLVNPVFGPLTHEQWIALNLRHAELHLSFLQAGGASVQS